MSKYSEIKSQEPIPLVQVKSTAPEKQFFNVTGMTCGACSGTIERALNGTDGIDSAVVSLLTEMAEVIFNPDVITPEEIVEEIEDVGFDASIAHMDIKGEVTLAILGSMDSAERESVQKLLLSEPAVTTVNISDDFHSNANEKNNQQDDHVLLHITLDLQQTSIRRLIKKLSDYGLNADLQRADGDLEATKEDMQRKRAGELQKWKNAFWTSMMFALPVFFILFICPNVPLLHHSLSHNLYGKFSVKILLLWLLSTPIQFGVGFRFYVAAYKSIKHGSATMDVLVSLGSSAAYLYSVVGVVLCMFDSDYNGKVFFETSAMLITVVLLGRYIENIAKGKTSDALSSLMSLQPRTATLLVHNDEGDVVNEEIIEPALLHQGDIVRVVGGGTIPVDGVVVKGKSAVNEALVTGESLPVSKTVGSHVIGGTINLHQPIDFRVTGVGSDTMLARIVRLVNQAQTSKAPVQDFADSVARKFVPVVCGISLFTWTVWYSLLSFDVIPNEWTQGMGNFLFSFMFAIAVLVISCPCALGLATPTAVMVGTGVGAKLGVLFKGGSPLEMTGKTTKVLFDKTGTLTQGKPTVNVSECALMLTQCALSHREFWCLVGTVENESEHVLGKAICQYAKSQCKGLGATNDFKAELGAGVRASVQLPASIKDKATHRYDVVIGNKRFLAAHEVKLGPGIEATLAKIQTTGSIAVVAAIDGMIAGVIAINDSIKPEAGMVVGKLEASGIKVYMVTGDNIRSATAIAKQIGIAPHRVIAQVTPGEKAQVVTRLQEARGGSSDADDASSKPIVMFVGDGINDSPSLAQADVGVAIAQGTDIAMETASVILMRNNLADVITAIDLSAHVLARIKANFRWAIFYNAIAIPIAAGALYPAFHITLNPVVASICMGFSSISVVLSSLLLKLYRRPSLHGSWADPSMQDPSQRSNHHAGHPSHSSLNKRGGARKGGGRRGSGNGSGSGSDDDDDDDGQRQNDGLQMEDSILLSGTYADGDNLDQDQDYTLNLSPELRAKPAIDLLVDDMDNSSFQNEFNNEMDYVDDDDAHVFDTSSLVSNGRLSSITPFSV